MKKKIFCIIFILGFCVFLSQIVIIRELFVIFYGNELTLGLIFFSWMLGNAAGSYISKIIIPEIKNKPLILAIGQVVLFIILFAIIFLLKSNLIFNKPVYGEIIGLGTMVLNSFIFITPFCFLSGFLFPLACLILNDYINEPSKASGYTYMLDVSGAVAAGLTGNFILIRYLSAWHIVFVTGTLLVLNCLLLYYFIYKSLNIMQGVIFSCFILSAFLPGFIRMLEDTSVKTRWPGYSVLANVSSVHGQITVLKKEDNISFYNNGSYAFTYPDQLTAEDIHLTALQNIEAKNALVIGGGLNGSLAELLKYKNINKVFYVEPDPLIIALAEKLLPKDAAPSGQRISILNTDGRAFVKNTPYKFDLVIMNVPEPYTSSINRFYTMEFFLEVKNILSPEGVFSLTLPSGENYISPERKRLLGTVYHTLFKVFSEVKIIPGGTNIFLSSRTGERITLDGSILGERLKTSKIDLLFLSPGQIPFRLSQERIEKLNLQLFPPQKLNKDFSPVNYFYDLLLWAGRASGRLVKFAYLLERIFTIENILGAVFTIGVLLLLLAKVNNTDHLPLAVMSAGFTGISLELIVSLIFQIKTGYLYYQLCFIIAGFMLGLALGGYFAAKYTRNIQNLKAAYNYLFLILSFYPLFMIIFIYFFLQNAGNINIMAFLTILFVPAFIIGCLFLFAGRISSDKNNDGMPFGKLYAYDLLGSAFGALFTTALFIPLMGIYSTLVVIAGVNLVVLSLNLLNSEYKINN